MLMDRVMGRIRFKSTKYALSLFNHHQCLTVLHLRQIQSNLTISGTLFDTFATEKLVATFANRPTHLSHAYKLLIHLPRRSRYMWNSLLKVFTDKKQPTIAIHLYKNMLGFDSLPNNFTFSYLIRASIDTFDFPLGLVLHGQSIKLNWESDDFVQNGLIHLYSICDAVESARKLFDLSLNKDVVTWTCLINGYLMVGRLGDARELFDEMPERNVVSWGSMVTGYAQMGNFREALELFNDMLVSGLRPNGPCLVAALGACASLGALDHGRWVHAYIDKNKLELNVKLGTALVDMYAKCGCIEMASRVFEDMPIKDVLAFTSLIAGLLNNGLCEMAIELFKRMQIDGIKPDGVTFACVLAACARMGLIDEGLAIFVSMKFRYGIDPEIRHYGCLVDLLARAGMLQEAKQLVTKTSLKLYSSTLGVLLNSRRVFGNVELVEETVKKLTMQGLYYSGAHALLSNIYASADKWDEVLEIREKMEEKELRCSSIEVDGIISVFGAGQRHPLVIEEIKLCLLRLNKHSQSFLLDCEPALERVYS